MTRLVGFAEGVGQVISVEQEPRDFSSVPYVHARVVINGKVYETDSPSSLRRLRGSIVATHALRAYNRGDRHVSDALVQRTRMERRRREYQERLAELRVPASLRHAREALHAARERLASATPGTDSYAFETRNAEIALRTVRGYGVHEDD